MIVEISKFPKTDGDIDIIGNQIDEQVCDEKIDLDARISFQERLSPMASISNVQEIVDAVVFLTEAPHVTGEVLHVDGGGHLGKW